MCLYCSDPHCSTRSWLVRGKPSRSHGKLEHVFRFFFLCFLFHVCFMQFVYYQFVDRCRRLRGICLLWQVCFAPIWIQFRTPSCLSRLFPLGICVKDSFDTEFWPKSFRSFRTYVVKDHDGDDDEVEKKCNKMMNCISFFCLGAH